MIIIVIIYFIFLSLNWGPTETSLAAAALLDRGRPSPKILGDVSGHISAV